MKDWVIRKAGSEAVGRLKEIKLVDVEAYLYSGEVRKRIINNENPTYSFTFEEVDMKFERAEKKLTITP